MPIDYYPNLTDPGNATGEDQLVAILEGLQRRATVGQVYMTTYSGDQNMRTFQGASKVKVEIRNVLYSLSIRSPSTYTNPYTQRIRRVSPSYY